ncbi:MAG: SRPBCC family protein [Pirellulaceae bacterium]|nr:SRPBCC family protein [Pirellulaceae bacterium]
MKQQMSVEIERPIEEVFEYTNKHVAEWSLTVVENVVTDEKPEGVGTAFCCITEDHGRRMEFQGVVTRHEPPTASAVHLTGQFFDIDAEYLFEDLGGRTRVTQRSSVAPKGFIRIFFFLFGWLVTRAGCKAQENELNNLKRLLEQRTKSPDALPDGHMHGGCNDRELSTKHGAEAANPP